MSSILDTLKSFNEDRIILENHPLKELELESKVTYLTGLALIMNADEDMQGSEKRYVATLIRTFDLPDTLLAELEQNATALEKDFIEEFKITLLNKDLVNTFFYDAVMICFQDGDYCKTEKAVIDQLCHLLDFSKSDMTFIEHLVKAINSNDLEYIESLDGEKFWQWEYLLDYKDIGYSPECLKASCSKDLNSLIKIAEPFASTIKLAEGRYTLTSDDIEDFIQVKIIGAGVENTTLYFEGEENTLKDDDDVYNHHSHEFNISGMNVVSIQDCKIDSWHPQLLILTTFDSDKKIFDGCDVDSDIEIDDAYDRAQKQIQSALDGFKGLFS